MRLRAAMVSAASLVLLATGCAGSKTHPPIGSPASPRSGDTPSAVGDAPPGTATAVPGGLTPVERVVQQLQSSVVRISVSGSASAHGPFGRSIGQGQAQGAGTGMVLDALGHILTNNHVVTLEGATAAPSLTIDLPNGRSVRATVTGSDPETDLAVIQVDQGERAGLKPIHWADASSIVVGEEVVAIGYALDLGGAPTVTTGVVSAIERNIPETDATISGAIQTDAAINPGNSGGPLLDLNGNVIGINTGGLAGTLQQPVQGLNFAISSQTARPVAQALVAQGRVPRGYIGVQVADVTPALAKTAGLAVSAGAGVAQITRGSPAAQAGLQIGDVIVKIGTLAIANTGDFTNALTTYGPGQQVQVTYYRGRNQTTTAVTLGQRAAGG